MPPARSECSAASSTPGVASCSRARCNCPGRWRNPAGCTSSTGADAERRSSSSTPAGPSWDIAADGTGFKPEKTVDREWPFGDRANFRLALQDALLEIYLDDVLIECYSLPAPATGRIGLIPGRRRNSVGRLKAWK